MNTITISSGQAVAIITILSGIFLILTGMFGFIIKIATGWANVKSDIRVLQEQFAQQIADNLRMHGENKELIHRVEDRINAIRNP